jgi:hypothetical protein
VIAALLDKNGGMPADILELKIYRKEKPIPITLKKDA